MHCIRNASRPLAALTLVTFVSGTLPRSARADEERAASDDSTHAATAARATRADEDVVDIGGDGPRAPAPASRASERTAASTERAPAAAAVARAGAAPMIPESAPIASRAATSSQSISVPSGSGKIQGMGESFSAQLSTGVATFSVPIALPVARGGASPSLSLAYDSGGGDGVAGIGWSIGVPFIARQTDRGLPGYSDPAGGWMPNQDRFVFNGGQELVPICLVSGATCAGALPAEQMPSWASGWQYFRPRVEGSFLRFFWSPDHRTWRVQAKSGESMELGSPLDGADATGALEVDPSAPSRVFRWNLTRTYDAQGDANASPPKPVNVVVYRYFVDGTLSYLSDIYDTPPVSGGASAPLSQFAHHTRLVYEWRGDVTTSYRRGWVTRQALRLHGVDVTSKPFDGDVSGPRKLVRRVHLGYDGSYHASLLTSVQVEGRCGAPSDGERGEPIAEDATGALPASTPCPRLPAMTFGYAHVAPYTSDGSASASTLTGYEGFDERVHDVSGSPPHSLDESLADLFDVNGDGLPDVVATIPGQYGAGHGLFLNGDGGRADTFGAASTMPILGVLGDTGATLTLDNENVSAGDVDGDGLVDLAHMPLQQRYAVYSPISVSGGWAWSGRVVDLAGLSPKINLGRDGLDTQRMDVNGDGFVDVVVSTGTEMETFFALGRYPGGDGLFGHASWTSATTASLSTEPVRTCVPHAGLPIHLSDADLKVGDMNGDGLPDFVRVHQGDIRYWPGRGNGFWGTGRLDDCPADTFGQGRDIAMASAPQYSDPNGSGLRLDDVNGDGLDDLVQVRFDAVDVWLNVDGTGWTPRHVIANAPPSPAYQNRVRITDINGSGTRDIVWGDGGRYRYMDLAGGARPWVLTRVANGLGKTTDLEYASSTSLMLADARAGQPWTATAPMPLHVVTRVTESDNLQVIGRPAGRYVTEYSYRDPVYDGRQREFRGFRTARARRVGDANSPSSTTTTTFLLGECKDEDAPAGAASICTPAGRWRDNPREALKGLPVTNETFDDNGVYLSTAHTTYRLRHLYTGLDGREVRHAFVSATDTWAYDTSPFAPSASPQSVTDVELERTPPALNASPNTYALAPVPGDVPSSVTLRSAAGRAHLRTRANVDAAGNAVIAQDDGCVDGCVASDGTSRPDDGIGHYSYPGTYGAADASGWIWRTWNEGTWGPADAYGRKYMFYTYDAHGNLLQSGVQVIGSLPLDRFHEDASKAVAPAPPEATAGGVVLSEYRQIDALGNVRFSKGPNHRCRTVDYDPTYAQLPTAEVVKVGPVGSDDCGTRALATVALYDRGLAAPLVVTNVSATTTARYDGFGRVVAVYRPDPSTGTAPVDATSAAVASIKIEYFLPPDPTVLAPDAKVRPYSLLHTQTQNGISAIDAVYRDSWAYVDGMGRTLVTLDPADPTAGDGGEWVVNGLTNYDAKGAAERAYLAWFWSGAPDAFPLSTTPTTAYSRQRYDAFGRAVQTFGLDGTMTLGHRYHALSSDAWDAADLAAGPHQGTYASERRDGHGRVVSTIERAHVGGKIDARETRTQYTSTGEPTVITRQRLGTSDTVVRWMRYDTAGRMLLNVEPDTSSGFTPNPVDFPAAVPNGLKAWRYAYNDAGDLVGTSDARGCGANYVYEAGGRLIGEDYSPCLRSHPDYTPADATARTGFEVLNHYDDPDPSVAAVPGFVVDARWTQGKLVSVRDRAGQSWTQFDARGRIVGLARRLVAPTGALAPRWYVQTVAFDAADRPVTETTGAVDAPAAGAQPALDVTSTVTTTYTKRGSVRNVASDHGPLVDHVIHDADGLALEIGYADVAKTTTSFQYDARRRLHSVQTYRGPPPIWSAPPATYSPAPERGGAPSTLQLLLEDLDFAYDEVDNPTEIRDWRVADEWPAGAKPVTRKMQYDDLYRVARIDYDYAAGDDAWVSPFDAEDQGSDPNPKRAQPSPHVRFDKRVRSQTYQYDWLGNTIASGDDARGFYDRSLGTITNGTAAAGPYQLKGATNGSSTPGSPSREGRLTAQYDAVGNLTSLALRRDGPCLPSGATCSQRFAYEWDEVGRLARARRWDLADPGQASDPIPDGAAAAELRYLYDATDDRALKEAIDGQGHARYALYPLDALELRGATWSDADGDYERSHATQVPYLFAHGVRLGRVAYAEEDLPSLTSGASHVFLELMDHLGSTGIVIDRDTGELVERSTYQGYGGAESDYRPGRWKAFREDYRFTGKEEDVEVGLQYFGKRYYAPSLQRWASADPLAIHGLGADMNAYAYVHGAVLKAIDSRGLVDSAPGTEGRRFLRSKATCGVATLGIPDADKVAAPAAQNPLNDPAIAKQLGLEGPATSFDADHIVSAAEIMNEEHFQKLTIEQQLDILHTPENLAMLDSRINQQFKGSLSATEMVNKYRLSLDAKLERSLLDMTNRAYTAIYDKISKYTAENARSGIDVRANDLNVLERYFAKNKVAQRVVSSVREGSSVSLEEPPTIEGQLELPLGRAVGGVEVEVEGAGSALERQETGAALRGIGRAANGFFMLMNVWGTYMMYLDYKQGKFARPKESDRT